jgi:hypothetical protein
MAEVREAPPARVPQAVRVLKAMLPADLRHMGRAQLLWAPTASTASNPVYAVVRHEVEVPREHHRTIGAVGFLEGDVGLAGAGQTVFGRRVGLQVGVQDRDGDVVDEDAGVQHPLVAKGQQASNIRSAD